MLYADDFGGTVSLQCWPAETEYALNMG